MVTSRKFWQGCCFTTARGWLWTAQRGALSCLPPRPAPETGAVSVKARVDRESELAQSVEMATLPFGGGWHGCLSNEAVTCLYQLRFSPCQGVTSIPAGQRVLHVATPFIANACNRLRFHFAFNEKAVTFTPRASIFEGRISKSPLLTSSEEECPSEGLFWWSVFWSRGSQFCLLGSPKDPDKMGALASVESSSMSFAGRFRVSPLFCGRVWSCLDSQEAHNAPLMFFVIYALFLFLFFQSIQPKTIFWGGGGSTTSHPRSPLGRTRRLATSIKEKGEEGQEQGDPLMLLLFSFGQHRAVVPVPRQFQDEECLFAWCLRHQTRCLSVTKRKTFLGGV